MNGLIETVGEGGLDVLPQVDVWFEPEKISSTDLTKAATERYLVFWDNAAPMNEKRSWVYGAEQFVTK